MKQQLVDKFWSYVKRTNDCWIWTAGLNTKGYGQSWNGERPMLAHRMAFILTYGLIPDGLELDHLCHTKDLNCLGGTGCQHRRCVNPSHLEAVTSRENSIRGRSPQLASARRRAITHCIRGHELSGSNVYMTPVGHRQCRICQALRTQKHYDKLARLLA